MLVGHYNTYPFIKIASIFDWGIQTKSFQTKLNQLINSRQRVCQKHDWADYMTHIFLHLYKYLRRHFCFKWFLRVSLFPPFIQYVRWLLRDSTSTLSSSQSREKLRRKMRRRRQATSHLSLLLFRPLPVALTFDLTCRQTKWKIGEVRAGDWREKGGWAVISWREFSSLTSAS